MRFRSLLLLAVLGPLLAASVAVITSSYLNADRRSTEMGERLLAAASSRAGQQTVVESKQAESLVRGVAGLAERGLVLEDSDALVMQLLALLRANTTIAWISFSDTAGTFTGAYRDAAGRTCINQSRIVDGKTRLIEQYVPADGPREVIRESADSKYDPRTRPFYRAAIAKQDLSWSPPYIFYGQGIPGISCSLALRKGDDVRGVISVDYDLNRLSASARDVAASPHSQVMVFTPEFVVLAHSSLPVAPVHRQELGDAGKLLTLENAGDEGTRAFYEELRHVELSSLQAGESHIIHFRQGHKRVMGCITPIRLASGPLQYVATIAPESDFVPSAWEFSRIPILIASIALLLGVHAAWWVSKRISRPLTTLVGASEHIGQGDLDVEFNLGRIREFRQLSEALAAMLRNLRDWMRVRSSLQLAMEIQRRLLPAKPPQIPGFDISGYCAYCDETGGDYYDYIVIDRSNPQKFIVALGDVMGHGLASALLMASARAVLRSSISKFTAPGAILTHLNQRLYEDTGGDRFMTMCLAAFDLQCAGCVWASAGHDTPIIYDPIEKTFLEPEGGDVPLGIMADVEYGNYQFGPICRDQIIVLGSDGVWDMFSESGDKFGKERLKQAIADHASGSADEIKAAILKALEQFRGTSAIKDDVTFVVIKECHVPAKVG